MIFFVLYLIFSTLLAQEEFQEIIDYQLVEGTQLNCQSNTFKATKQGNQTILKFSYNPQIGYSQIIYTFNLYEQLQQNVFFKENDYETTYIEQQLLQNQVSFLACNELHTKLSFFKIQSKASINENTITFTMHKDYVWYAKSYDQFLISQFKIFLNRCQNQCVKCTSRYDCQQCLPDFELINYMGNYCQCPYEKPFLHLDACYAQCPNGYYGFQYSCHQYSSFTNLFYDNLASQFTLESMSNPTQRIAKFYNGSKIFSGPFFENEAIIYTLPQPIISTSSILVDLEILLLNTKQLFTLNFYFDEVIIEEFFVSYYYTFSKFNNRMQKCNLNQFEFCSRVRLNFLFKSIEQLTTIKINGNFPLKNQYISWAVGFIRLDKIELPPVLPCLNKQYFDQCVQKCPLVSKEVGQVCESLINQFEFAEIVHTEFDDDNFLKSQYIESFDSLNSQMHIEINFLQIYNNRYIYGGYKKQILDNLKIISSSNHHYKIKVYMKLLLIDPFDASDKMKVQIDDNVFTFSKYHPDAQCFNNAGTNGCFQQEEIGSAATDYLIIFEQEILHSKMELKLRIGCDSSQQYFYCAYYDLVAISVLCPINCIKCISDTECIEEDYKSVFAKSNILYECPSQGYYRDNGQCSKCSEDCLECTNGLECTVCKDNYYPMSGYCICKYNNVNGYYTDCSNSCDGACSTCENSDKILQQNPMKYKKCSECKLSENKVLNEVICVCLDGYFMNKTTFPYQCQRCNYGCSTCEDEIHCLSCNAEQNRVFENKKCSCQQGFYEFNTLSPICLQCNPNCNTCLNSPDICTSCFVIQNRILTPLNTCDCRPGYFENSNKICEKCSNTCETCSDYAVCSTCAEEQFRQLKKSTCICIEGFYESNNQCQRCHYSCSQCNFNNYQNQCTTCPITRMKLLKMQKISECICKPGYYDVGDLQCLSCQDLQNISINHECYSKCGDQIIQWNEECDDGNSEPRDGCDQCLLPDSYCFDTKCEECQSKKCIKCVDRYYLNQENKCFKCSDNCLKCQNSENNCTECKFLDSTGKSCIDCSEELGYTEYDGNCYSICGDGIITDSEQCDDNNNLNGDGCSRNCLIEEEYICNSTCEKIQLIQIYLTENKFDSIYDDKRTIFLYFSHQVEFLSDEVSNCLKILPIQENLNYSILNITINNDDQQQFQTMSIQIIVQLNQSYQAPKYSIELLNNTIIQSLDGFQFKKNNIQIITLIDFQKQEQLTVVLTKNIINVDSYLLYFLGAFACLAFLLGGLEIFWNLLDTIQLISYLKYYNVTLPYNLEQYFQLFSFAEFDFLKQYFDVSPFINKYADISEPYPKFSKEGYSTLFIINIISVIVVFIITILTILIIKFILQFLLKITKKQYLDQQQNQEYQYQQQKIWILKILQKIQNRFLMLLIESKNAILRTFMCTALDLNMAIFLQLNNLKFSNPIFLFSDCLCFLVILIEIKLILQGINTINMVKSYSRDQRKQFNAVYFEGVQLKNGSFHAYLNIINLMKKILFMAFLVTLYNYPFFQIGLTSALSLSFSVFLYQKKSLVNLIEQIKQMITEFFIWLTQILIIILSSSQNHVWYNENYFNYIGWTIIGLLNFIILVQLFLDIKQHFQFLQKKYKILTYLKEILAKIFDQESQNETQFTTESEGLGLQKNSLNTESSFLQNHNKNNAGQRILISFKLNQPVLK